MEGKKKLFLTVAQWLINDGKNEPVEFDYSELYVIFKTLGFKLEKLEKNVAGQGGQNYTTIDITCGKSGVHGVLTKENVNCTCCTDKKANANGEVVSSNITNKERLDTPTVNPRKLQRCISETTFVLSNTRPHVTQTVLKKQYSSEVDLNSSPVQTSTPVKTLFMRLSHVLKNTEINNSIVENLRAAQTLLDSCLNMALNTTQPADRRISDIKPSEGPTVQELKLEMPSVCNSVTPNRLSISRSSLKKPIEKKIFRSALPSPKKPFTSTNSGISSPSLLRKTNTNGGEFRRNNFSSGESKIKSKIASYVRLTPKTNNKLGKLEEKAGVEPRVRNNIKYSCSTLGKS